MKNSIFNAVCKTRYLALLVVLILTCGNAWGAGTTVTYTLTAKTTVSKSGTAPTGATATVTSTGSWYTSGSDGRTNTDQMTAGKNTVLTLSGFEGYKITGIVLNMCSNSSNGKGTFSAVAGSTTIASISSATNFNAWYDNTSYGTSRRNVTVSLTNSTYEIKKDEDVVITIACVTTNSLYISSWAITYEAAGGGCDKEVSLATSLSNCTATFTPSGPVKTCSATASDRQVSVSITPTTGYELTSGPTVSGVTGATISGSGPYTIQLPQNGNGELTLSATCSAISVTGVSLNKNSTTIAEGSTETLTATITPSNALDQAVTWLSGTPGVATVNSSGVVTAVSAGNATITVTTHDGSYTATCTVTVTAVPKDHFIDAMHSTTGYTGDGMEKVGNYSASIPSIADKAKNTTGTCQEKHYHFAGWVTAANRANPEGNLVTLDGNASNTTYYAVWTKEGTGSSAWDGSTEGAYKIYTDISGTKYYATGTGTKIASTTTAASATEYTFAKVTSGGNTYWTIKTGNNYITKGSSNTDFGTSTTAYNWTIEASGTANGTWKIIASSSTSRGFIFRSSTYNQYGTYTIGGVNGTEYYFVEIEGTVSYEDPKTSCSSDPVDPTVTFSNGEYTVGGLALDLRTLWTSNNTTGAVTFTVTNDNGTGATIAGDGYSLSATTAGSCTVQASQAAVAGVWNAISRTAMITVNPPTCATPTFNNETGTYYNDVTVAISCATASSTIHYTTGASPADPTCSTGLTGTSVTINATGTTLKAVACKADYNVSAVASATYTLKCATPTFSVAAGTYSSAQSVTLSCTTDGATIKYTTDGRDPATYGTTYSSAITISDDVTLKVIATKTNYVNSDLASAAYVIKDCDWYESFDNCDGAGGNSGNWYGYSNMGTPVYDHDGWTVNAGAGKGDKCIKAGTSGTRGTAQTPSITVDNATTYKLSFRMAPWNSTTTTASFTLSGGEISSGVSTWTSASDMSDGEWNDYQVSITTTSTSLQITFTTGSGENRFWLDEVCLKGPSSYTVTFNANGHGTAPSAITDVAKNATISKPTPDPSATGWTFGGWYKEPACTNAWTWATDQVTSNTTLYAKWTCSNPSSLTISSTGSKYDFCAGESMTLTVSGDDIGDGATYQWNLGGSPIEGATSASYTTTMAAAKAGEYTCTVSNGSCSQTTSGFWVRVWQLHLGDDDIDFTYVSGTTGSNSTVHLNSDTHYEFKLKDNNGGWFGLNDKTITATISAFALNGSGANVNVTSGLEGNYTFTINYSDKNNPTIAVTYPVGNQPSGRSIWFDKSVVTGWNSEGTSDLYYRIGKSTNHTNNTKTGGTAWTLVPGTDKFYTTKTMAYDGFEAWAISNNAAWCDNSSDTHSIYGNATDGYKITKAIDFQKYVVGASGVTIVPTSSHNTDGNGCNYWYVSKTDGMLTHTATITTPSHGTITIANAAQSLEETTTTADLPHRTILTITATPATGYNLTSLTVNDAAFTSGNTHILAADATIAATFTAKVITVTWNVNGGTALYPGTSSYTYDGDALVMPTPTKDGKVFAGWYTLAEGGDEVTDVGGANKPTADVEYFAHWSDGNRVVFHPGAGTVSPDVVTQLTVGGSVTLSTPTPTCDGWTFQGWKVGSEQTDVTELPDGLLAGGSSYVPASATVDMYAVYKKTFEETTPHTSTYDWDNTVTGWSTSTGISTNKGTQGVGSSKCGEFSANGSYVIFNTKVKVKNFSLYMRRSSNNTKGTGKIQKSTDGTNWTDVLTWSMSDIAQDACTQKSTTFDGSTEYYVQFFYVADGSAIRYIDNVSITYNTVDNVTHYATSPLECSQVATPLISPEGDTYTGAQSITITCATAGATIKYTTDGTDPSSSNGTTIATGSSFTLSCSGTVKAIAYKDGMADSDIASETYIIKVPDPTFSPDGGDFKVAQSVSLSSAFAGTTVYYEYTTDGSEPSDPTSSSTAYSSTPISVAVGQTVRIKAIGINGCATNSNIVSKTFRVGWDFELVTDEDDLNVGDKIVILSGSTAALSTYQGSNNRTSSSDFDISGTTVTAYPASTNSSTTVQVLTLAGGAGEWRLKPDASHYLNVPSDGKLTTHSEDGNSRQWTIDIGSSPNYYATITNNEYTSCKIEYGTVFAAYSTGQNPVKIYSIANPDPLIKVEGTLTAFAGCTGAASDAQSFYVSGKNLSASILVTAPTGYEVSLSSGSGYAGSLEVARVGTAVSKTQVYVRLKSGSAGAVAATNVVVSVEANSLSQNVAIPASTISAADTYIDRMHGAADQYGCGSYSAPTLVDFEGEGTDCQENYAIFQGWVAADQINLDGTLKAGATVVAGGTPKTASGTTYYSIWEALDE